MKASQIICLVLIFILIQSFGDDFSYEHQEQWGGVCNTGKRQSPINIVSRNMIFCPKHKILIKKISTSQTIINSQGIDLKANYVNESKLIYYDDGKVGYYPSIQFHWHSPSQHTVNGNSFDLQLHIVHSEATNNSNLAVIGLLFRVNQSLTNDPFDDAEITTQGKNVQFKFPFDIVNKMVYHYEGSLTTPPCSQTVEWFVITQPYQISKKNFQKIKAAINEGKPNARYVQERFGRNTWFLGKFCDYFVN